MPMAMAWPAATLLMHTGSNSTVFMPSAIPYAYSSPKLNNSTKTVFLSIQARQNHIPRSMTRVSSSNSTFLAGRSFLFREIRPTTETRRYGGRVIKCQGPGGNGRITQQEFTEMAWQAVVTAPEVAKESKHQIVETEHLMKALQEQKNGLARRIFAKVGVDNTALLQATERFIQRQPKVLSEAGGSMLGRDLEALIQRSRDYKKEYGDSFVSVEHLLLAFAQDKRFGQQLFKDFQISLKSLQSAIQAIRGSQKVIDQDPEGKYEVLDKYGKDLTEMARQGKLDPVIGRDDEIRRCIQILSRRTKK